LRTCGERDSLVSAPGPHGAARLAPTAALASSRGREEQASNAVTIELPLSTRAPLPPGSSANRGGPGRCSTHGSAPAHAARASDPIPETHTLVGADDVGTATTSRRHDVETASRRDGTHVETAPRRRH